MYSERRLTESAGVQSAWFVSFKLLNLSSVDEKSYEVYSTIAGNQLLIIMKFSSLGFKYPDRIYSTQEQRSILIKPILIEEVKKRDMAQDQERAKS